MDVRSKTKKMLDSSNFDSKLKDLVSSYEEEWEDQLLYYYKAGGKRIRPALAHASYFISGGENEEVTNYAIALELTHNCSLLIDDIQDSAEIRRQVPTHHKKFSSDMAILDALEIQNILNFALESYGEKIRKLAWRSTLELIDGQKEDLLAEQGREHEYFEENRIKEIDLKSYSEIIEKKTGSLIEAACEGGGIIAGADDEEISSLKNYGRNFGLSYQIQDDRLDFLGEKEKLGKEIGKDIRQGKISNIVISLALEELNKGERKAYRELIKKERKREKDMDKIKKLTFKTQALDKAGSIMQSFGEKALKVLELFPESEYKQYMQELVKFNSERKR